MKTYPTFEQGIHYDDLHTDHEAWLDELEFCKQEIIFFRNLLENYAKTDGNASKAVVEQFQNKLIIYDEQIDLLLHEIHEREKKLIDFIKSHEKNIEFITFSDHKEQRDKMNLHRKLYSEMKHEYYNAVTKK